MVETVCRTLALKICWDGEGVTKVVRIQVARGQDGDSQPGRLRKRSLHPTWSRQRCSAEMQTGAASWPPSDALGFLSIPIAREPSIWKCRNGPAGTRSRTLLLNDGSPKSSSKREFTILVDLGLGTAESHMWTTDLSYEYVRINASYRS